MHQSTTTSKHDNGKASFIIGYDCLKEQGTDKPYLLETIRFEFAGNNSAAGENIHKRTFETLLERYDNIIVYQPKAASIANCIPECERAIVATSPESFLAAISESATLNTLIILDHRPNPSADVTDMDIEPDHLRRVMDRLGLTDVDIMNSSELVMLLGRKDVFFDLHQDSHLLPHTLLLNLQVHSHEDIVQQLDSFPEDCEFILKPAHNANGRGVIKLKSVNQVLAVLQHLRDGTVLDDAANLDEDSLAAIQELKDTDDKGLILQTWIEPSKIEQEGRSYNVVDRVFCLFRCIDGQVTVEVISGHKQKAHTALSSSNASFVSNRGVAEDNENMMPLSEDDLAAYQASFQDALLPMARRVFSLDICQWHQQVTHHENPNAAYFRENLLLLSITSSAEYRHLEKPENMSPGLWCSTAVTKLLSNLQSEYYLLPSEVVIDRDLLNWFMALSFELGTSIDDKVAMTFCIIFLRFLDTHLLLQNDLAENYEPLRNKLLAVIGSQYDVNDNQQANELLKHFFSVRGDVDVLDAINQVQTTVTGYRSNMVQMVFASQKDPREFFLKQVSNARLLFALYFNDTSLCRTLLPESAIDHLNNSQHIEDFLSFLINTLRILERSRELSVYLDRMTYLLQQGQSIQPIINTFQRFSTHMELLLRKINSTAVSLYSFAIKQQEAKKNHKGLFKLAFIYFKQLLDNFDAVPEEHREPWDEFVTSIHFMAADCKLRSQDYKTAKTMFERIVSETSDTDFKDDANKAIRYCNMMMPSAAGALGLLGQSDASEAGVEEHCLDTAVREAKTELKK